MFRLLVDPHSIRGIAHGYLFHIWRAFQLTRPTYCWPSALPVPSPEGVDWTADRLEWPPGWRWGRTRWSRTSADPSRAETSNSPPILTFDGGSSFKDWLFQAFLDVFLAMEDSGFAGNLRFLEILPRVLGKLLSFWWILPDFRQKSLCLIKYLLKFLKSLPEFWVLGKKFLSFEFFELEFLSECP